MVEKQRSNLNSWQLANMVLFIELESLIAAFFNAPFAILLLIAAPTALNYAYDDRSKVY